ncbi:MAG: glycosyltransferase [Planctomycetes bacterium]|nr:glycosyltransferase [Planctomycetota bacterium]
MRVLLVANGFPPSGQWGTEYYTHQLATGLVRRGHAVTVLVPARDGERERYSLTRARRYGVEVVELANAGDPRKAFADSYANASVERVFDELCGELRPEVVHFTHLLWGLSVDLPRVAARRGARTLVTVTDFGLLCHRGQLLDWRDAECAEPGDPERCARCVREPARWDAPPAPRELKRLAVRAAARAGRAGRVVVPADLARRAAHVARATESVDHWIFPTRTLARTFQARGWRARASSVLAYGIDEARYALPRPPRAAEGTRFTFMSQYMPHKGLACLLEATRRLAHSAGDAAWSVELWGNGGRDRARRYAELLVHRGLPARVSDRGSFEPLRAPEVLAQSDCVLVPSLWRENAPLTVLQARAAGVPVLASDVPGIREVLEDGRHGRLLPPGDAGALAAAMEAVVRGRGVAARPDLLVRQAAHLDAIEALYAPASREPRRAAARARALVEQA